MKVLKIVIIPKLIIGKKICKKKKTNKKLEIPHRKNSSKIFGKS